MRITLPNPLGAPITLGLDPDAMRSSSRAFPRTYSMQRRGRVVATVVLLVLCYILWPGPPLPPSYAREWAREGRLPQHNRWLAPPEGRNGRYLRFDAPSSDTCLHGQLQNALLHHHAALSSNRSFAFDPIVQSDSIFPIVWTSWPWRSSRIPLSAVSSNAVSGFEKLTKHPRAVSAKHYSGVCWRRERVYTVRGPQFPNGDLELVGGGKARLEQLEQLLAGEDGCVRIRGDVFGNDFLDTPEAMDLIHSLIYSPVLQHFTLGTNVLEVLNRAMPLLAPSSEQYDLQVRAHGKAAKKTTHWKHILALQIPHTEAWKASCRAFGDRSVPFTAFNKLSGLPGNENVPPPPDMAEASRLGLYNAKCVPETTAVIARARRMRKNHPILRTIYLITDGTPEWAEELSRWLLSDGWDKVFIAKLDVHAAWTDQEVAPAVDVEVARRAGVFVGNGFTTMASNVALLRTRDLVHPDLTQLW